MRTQLTLVGALLLPWLFSASAEAHHDECAQYLVHEAFGGLVIDHPIGLPVLSVNPASCATYGALDHVDALCTAFGASRGLDVELGFFQGEDEAGAFCGCACPQTSTSCWSADGFRDAFEEHFSPGHDYVVTDDAEVFYHVLLEDESCLPIECDRLGSFFNLELATFEAEVDGMRQCGCTCDGCSPNAPAEQMGILDWDDMPTQQDDGTVSYTITSARQLASIGAHLEALSADYRQCRDIRLDDWYAAAEGDEAGRPYFTIGTDLVPFSGTYDGDGYTVAGFTWDEDGPALADLAGGIFTEDGATLLRDNQDFIGLFGRADGAEIRNLKVGDADVVVHGAHVGVLAGELTGSVASDVQTTGTMAVVGSDVGGVAGRLASSHLQDATTEVLVNSTFSADRTGNLVGSGEDCTIHRSSAHGQAYGYTAVGGLAGYLDSASVVSDSYARSTVFGAFVVGGLVGDLGGGTISRSYHADGEVNGWFSAAGLVGDLGPGGEVRDSIVMSGLIMAPMPHIAAPTPLPAGAQVTNVHHWSGQPCTFGFCSNGAGSISNPFGTTEEAQAHFGNPASDPTNQWDFGVVWTQVPGGLPAH
jgi:hypothetical protein